MPDMEMTMAGGAGTGETGAAGGAGTPAAVTPFSTVAKGAAMRRMRQAQAAMGKTLTLAQAAEKGREEAKKKKEEADATAAREREKGTAMELDEGMEGDEEVDEVVLEEVEEEEDDHSLKEVTRNLAKESSAPSMKKKCRSEELLKTKGSGARAAPTAAATTVLRPSSFTPHTYRHPRVVIEGSARLEKDDKVKEFMELNDELI